MKRTSDARIKEESQIEKKAYFSPRRTRNQQRRDHLKIEYEESIEKKAKIIPKDESELLPSTSSNLSDFEFRKKKGLSSKVVLMTKAEESQWEPINWRQTLQNIRVMREKILAPVDIMGCNQCADITADEKTQRYHCLLSLMLSSQTKDQITYDAMNRLKSQVKPALQPENVIKLNETDLAEMLKPVSFYKTKAKHIKLTTDILVNQYDSDIPDTIEGLLKLPGVGKKMAFLAMKSAWNKVAGIGVDTHVHRISNWLKWVPKPTKTPEETRVALEHWLPQDLWDEANHLIVGFGQTVCHAIRPKCDICANASICPAKQLPKQSKSPRKSKMPKKEGKIE